MAKPTGAKTPRAARGKRPKYFADPALDQMHATLLAVTAELSVLQDRFDLIERVLDSRGVLTKADLEAYELDDNAEAERNVKRDQLVRRLFRDISAIRKLD